ncbi:hypothetical protein SBOR_7152 [Sclerotinia borealis F-4128]|uniref:Xylose isomerase-like TIM barrel domain-containing protein n=1 Tax=Sclerotinia borealis (strain F-4128) TaxID=1432307 RepID=W9CCD0_SCLBF|nr:hypothetical protein SBOR_7152 [Sclerotinia borealis F-4128]
MSYKPAIASMSLGRCFAHHSLETKFKAARDAGLSGMEMFYEDIADLASTLPSHPSPSSHIHAAQYIRSLSSYYALPIIACGPFSNYEGLLSPSARASKRQELHLWFQVCRILGTDLIQVPSTFAPPSTHTSSLSQIICDLRELADLGAAQKPPFRFAFENLCFGTYIDTWSGAWEVVQGVDRENFGMCLDTFNIAGREFADPASSTGTVPNAQEAFTKSMEKMVQAIDAKKVFYIQIADAERLAVPLVEGNEYYVEGQKARMSWSRNCRLFLGEQNRGGYLPVMDVVKAICDGLGYKGWVSFELFNRSLVAKGDHVPREHAERAMRSWKYVCGEMGWDNVGANVYERRLEREKRGEVGSGVMAKL